jgi:hypothetical protein
MNYLAEIWYIWLRDQLFRNRKMQFEGYNFPHSKKSNPSKMLLERVDQELTSE